MVRLCGVFLIFTAMAFAQGQPEAGGNEFQMWTGAGHSVAGGTGGTRLFNVGLRYGWVLTEPHAPDFLKGSFDYAVYDVPRSLWFQTANTAYGVGGNPC